MNQQQEQWRERARAEACDELRRCGRELVKLRAEGAAVAIALADLQRCSRFHALADNGHLASAITSLDDVLERLTEARARLLIHEAVVVECDLHSVDLSSLKEAT